MEPAVQDGMSVEIEYSLTVDGVVMDSSQGREPLSYVHGQGQLISGLERQLAGLHVGDRRDLTVAADEAYGKVDPDAFLDVPKTMLPEDVTPEVGMMLSGMGADGQPFRAVIDGIGEETVKLNLNHPLAGKTLHFAVTIAKIAPAR